MAEPSWTEADRLAALRRHAILDTSSEPEFDDAVALVRSICRVPIALVSLVDASRQWFKARSGVDATETGLDTSVCALAIRQRGLFVIEDLSADPRTAAMSLVAGEPNIRFYAGMPLVTADGFPLGSLCAIDVVPRPAGLDADQAAALAVLARQVVTQIELRTAVSARDRAAVAGQRRQEQASHDSAVLQAMIDTQQQVLTRGGDEAAMLQALVDAALLAVPAADGVVVEEPAGDVLVPRAAAGRAAGQDGVRLPIRGSLSGLALTSRTTLVSADAVSDPRLDGALSARLGIGSMVVLPLVRHGAPFGVLKVRSAALDAFGSRDIQLCQLLAGLISAGISETAEAAALRNVAQARADYRHVLDSVVDSAIVSMDEDGCITSWSRGAEHITGWTEAEALGQSLELIFTDEDRAAGRFASERAQAAAAGRAPCTGWQRRRDGSRFYAEGVLAQLLGSDKGFVKSMRDVTDAFATRTALEATRLRIDTALDTGLIGFFSWDVRAGRLTGDPRFAEFHGLDVDRAASGVTMEELAGRVAPQDRPAVAAAFVAARANCEDFSHSHRVIDAAGAVRWMQVRGRCVDRDGDRPVTFVGTAVDVTQQHEAEDQLRLSRERLELALHAAELGSFDHLAQTGELTWDDRCRALFGLPPGTPVTYQDTFLAGLHPDDRDRADAAVRAALDPVGGGTFDIEYRTVGLLDGVERTLLAKGIVLFDGGAATRLIGTVQDVTADRRARAGLAEAEERFRLAVRATNDAIWDWDFRTGQVRWNDALAAVYGHRLPGSLSTADWWIDHIHPDDRARIGATIHAVIDGAGSDWADEYRFVRADGSFADVRDRGTVIRDETGAAVRMVGALLDQSERVAMERELQALNRSLETRVDERTQELDRLWQSSPDLLVVLGADGRVLRVNPAWTAILGYTPHELVGRYVTDFLHPDDVRDTASRLAAAASGPMPPIENRLLHKDGTPRCLSWVSAPTGGEIYATGRHVTAEREAQAALHAAEEQLRQAQKVEAIGQLTGGVAHDFNNLLTVIRGSVDLLRAPTLSEERRRRYLDAIGSTADRAAKLTSQLLAFARRSSLMPEPFDVGEALSALRDMMGTITGSMIEVTLELPDRPCVIHADRSQFDTAIINMAVNARDAMDRRGTLSIAVRPAGAIPGQRAGDFVAVSIADTGAGIPAEVIDRIFEPFFTSKGVGEGTGLGLSQVFGFAKQSGGEILVSSRPGEGATFTLYLPRTGADAHPVDGAGADPLPRTGARCVLVVEDNADVGAFATAALGELGHTVVLAAGAEPALVALEIEPQRFDAVFSDVVMPGMTGIEFGREVHKLYPHLPVLLASGYSSVLAEEGTHGFELLHKPYSVAELARALGRVIARGR